MAEIVGIIFGTSIVLIPIAGLTLRFTLKPIVEALAAARGTRKMDQEYALLEKRVALLERQLDALGAQRGLPAVTSVGVPLPEGTLPVTRIAER